MQKGSSPTVAKHEAATIIIITSCLFRGLGFRVCDAATGAETADARQSV